jgi:superfamily I DNA and/or RNA helicase
LHQWARLKDVRNGIKACDVVLSTCFTAGSEVMKKAGNFDFIIIDEAGQVFEPDALIPLARFLKQTTVVAIVGDTQLLGPTILSQDTIVRSILGNSFMARISASQSSDSIFTSLNVQYRMHPDIAKFVSQSFYTGALCSEHNPEPTKYTPPTWSLFRSVY